MVATVRFLASKAGTIILALQYAVRAKRFSRGGTRVLNRSIRSGFVTGALLVWAAAVAHGVAQTPPAQTPPAGAPAPRVRPEAYPQREPEDPAVVARGKALYSVTCGFCHGSDARGG